MVSSLRSPNAQHLLDTDQQSAILQCTSMKNYHSTNKGIVIMGCIVPRCSRRKLEKIAYNSCRTPRAINMPNAQSVGNPHPDATGLNKAAGIDVVLTLQYTRTNLSGPTYMVGNTF